jgi:hypothetical protein
MESGVIAGEAASCAWALDGGALHLHRFDGQTGEVAALVAQAERIAVEHNAAVCVATLDAFDRWVEPLAGCGFERDDAELYVRDGEVRTEVTLLRVVQSG